MILREKFLHKATRLLRVTAGLAPRGEIQYAAKRQKKIECDSGALRKGISSPAETYFSDNRVFTAGFSLIEMLVTFTIVIILSGIFIGYNRTSGKQLFLYSEQAKVVGVLNEAKSYAIQRMKDTDTREDIVACAYGVEFEMGGAYRVFAAIKNVNDDGCPLDNRTIVKTYTLAPGVRFISLPPDNMVAFEIPYLTTHNSGTVRLGIDAVQKDIEISQGGAITPR